MFPHTKPPAGTQINPLHPLSNGLVGCWLFNEGAGSLANDLSGNKNHGRLTNVAPNVQGSGWGVDGLKVDGVDDYVDCGNINIVDDWTVCFWVKSIDVSDVVNYPIGLDIEKGIGLGGSWENISNDIYVWDNNVVLHGGSSIVAGDWYFVTVTKNGTTYTIYENSTQVASGVRGDINISNLYIGTRSDGYSFGGSIRFVYIWNQVKSAEEISWLYREPYAMFDKPLSPALLYIATAAGAENPYWYYEMLRRRNR